MPGRLPFAVVFCTGADDGFPAPALAEAAGPAARGWLTPRFCQWPQEIVLALAETARLRKIQILSHQTSIATRLELYVGTVPTALAASPDVRYDQCSFVRLGHITLADNSETHYQSRELKSIHVDVMARFLRIVIAKNHVNPHNLYNQVGLVAVNLLGDPLGGPSGTALLPASIPPESSRTAIDVHATMALTATSAGRAAPASGALSSIAHSGRIIGISPMDAHLAHGVANSSLDPTVLGLINAPIVSPYDDLAFSSSSDVETASLLRRLAGQKDEAVAAEDYVRAKELKINMATLSRASEELGRLEQLKARAVEQEDFDTAAEIKSRVTEIRGKLYQLVGIRDTPHGPEFQMPKTPPLPRIGSAAARSKTITASSKPDPRSMKTETAPSAAVAAGAPPPPLPPPPPPEVVAKPPTPELESMVPPPLRPIAPVTRSGSPPIPALRNGRAAAPPNEYPDDLGDQALRTRGPKSTRGTGAVPGSNTGLRVPSRAGERPSSGGDGPEPLRPQQLETHATAIAAFGERTVQGILARGWSWRVEALKTVEKTANRGDFWGSNRQSPLVLCTALAPILAGVLNDKVFAVFQQLSQVFRSILAGSSGILSSNDASALLNPLAPLLIGKCGDSAARTASAAHELALDLLNNKAVKESGALQRALLGPVNDKVAWRDLTGRLLLLAATIGKIGISPTLPLSSIASVASAGLKHPRREVREAAIAVVVAAAKLPQGRGIDRELHLGKEDEAIKKTLDAALGKQAGPPRQRSGIPPPSPSPTRMGRLAAAGGGAMHAKSRSPSPRAWSPQPPRKAAPGRVPESGQSLNERSPSPLPLKKSSMANTAAKPNAKKVTLAPPVTPPATPPDYDPVVDALRQLEQTCIFCGRADPAFEETTLDAHYWKECPMLRKCKFCGQVLEIATLHQHWAHECSAKSQFKLCARCGETIPSTPGAAHTCRPPPEGQDCCPLCHSHVLATEEGWKAHFMGSSKCSHAAKTGFPVGPVAETSGAASVVKSEPTLPGKARPVSGIPAPAKSTAPARRPPIPTSIPSYKH